jgi:hypothetical protein
MGVLLKYHTIHSKVFSEKIPVSVHLIYPVCNLQSLDYTQ